MGTENVVPNCGDGFGTKNVVPNCGDDLGEKNILPNCGDDLGAENMVPNCGVTCCTQHLRVAAPKMIEDDERVKER